jgi:hypothetical protein
MARSGTPTRNGIFTLVREQIKGAFGWERRNGMSHLYFSLLEGKG